MNKTRRYIDIYRKAVKSLFLALLFLLIVTGCGQNREIVGTSENGGPLIDLAKLKNDNRDIFAWIYVPGTSINGPLLQNADGDDSFYATHNVAKEPDAAGSYYIEAANMSDMCDFNEVVHGVPTEELSKFLDRSYFEDQQYIHVYMEGNSLIYYIIAAYTRENTRLLEQYDFSYASGCQQFIDEIYSGRTMSKNIRPGWETGLEPSHFLLTFTSDDSDRQIVVIGCLIGDAAGKIDREVDWGNPEEDFSLIGWSNP
ncbi:sortase B [Butyrivibrio proteoclasticus]|uniref:Sortase B n=1 Tax=Butyrivibrio proteoclasticus TaxID=43305 RepID=A0A1I5T7P6_9FIRM|nr:class B sortase [Butyrivibrio proteoclasticus]SFP79060.1 sortase B [Butyrivibrio proteoclasticus]